MNAPQLPAHLAKLANRNIAATISANLGVSSPPYVSIMGNRFTLVDGAGNERPVETYDPKTGPYLDCVIVDNLERVSKIFYASAFDPSAQSYAPPDCFSDNGVGPSRQAGNPQSRTCAECPNNVWGSEVSAVSGKGIKACSDFQKIAVLVPSLPDTVFLLRVPPNSLKPFRQYAEQYRGRDFDMNALVTRISFLPGTLGTLQFTPVTYVDEPTAAAMLKIYESKATDAMLGRTDLPREGLPAPAATAHLPAPAAQPAPAFAPMTAQQAEHSHQPAPAGNGQQTAPRGRPRRNTQAAAPAPGQPAQAPFMPAQPQAQPAPLASQANPAFGIDPNPLAPNADVKNALDNLFGKQ